MSENRGGADDHPRRQQCNRPEREVQAPGWHHARMRLETERLILRAWEPGDREPYAAMGADPAVMEFMPSLLSRAESDGMVDRLVQHHAVNGFGPWALETKADGGFVGFVGLLRPNFEAPFTPCVEVAWRLARSAWGHGYATEAARAATRDGFDRLGLSEILSFTVPANVRSIRVMERLGMARDPMADFDHPRLPEGHRLRRHVLYRLRG